MSDYRHYVYLTYETSEQLNRHAKRLIDKEGFWSGGRQPDARYLFVKDISADDYDRLIRFGREEFTYGEAKIAIELRTAW